MTLSVSTQLAAEDVAADTPAAPITIPTSAAHPNETIWYVIRADATTDVELVVDAGDTAGLPIPAGSGLVVLGPYRLTAVLAGTAPRFLFAAAPVSVRVVVSRSG